MEKGHVNLVFVGHVSHGKSTLVGRLLYDSGTIREEEMRKLKALAAELKLATFEFAFVMDAAREERERGMTIDIAWKELETPHNKITIIDAPGHRDFIKNMITGASDADAAVLVVDGQLGVQPQTKEHVFLIKTLGVGQLIVAINMMDKLGYSKQKFEEAKAQVEKLIRSVGYNEYAFIPLSAYLGDNVFKKSQNMSWYSGPTLFEAIDKLKEPEKPLDKPLRIPIDKAYAIKGVGAVPIGRVETGVMKVGDTVIFTPSGVKGEVRSIEMHHQQLQRAEPGDNIGFNVRGADYKQIRRGDVCSHVDKAPRVVSQDGWIECKIVVLEHKTGLAIGHMPTMFIHTVDAPVRIIEMVSKTDATTGEEMEKAPKLLRTGDAGVIRLQPLQPFVVEKTSEIPQMSRFALREAGITVAAGIVTDISYG